MTHPALRAPLPRGDLPGTWDFHNVVVDYTFDFFEPVGCSRGNNDHVTLAEEVAIAAANSLSSNLTRCDSSTLMDGSSRDKRSGSFQDIHNVDLSCVYFGLTRTFAVTGVNFVLSCLNEWGSFSERSCHLLTIQIEDPGLPSLHLGQTEDKDRKTEGHNKFFC